jgi:hypothetical protein
MNHIELMYELNTCIVHNKEPLTVVVPTSDGMGGPCVEVTGIHVGFDWYHGRLMIGTETPLSTIDPEKYSELKILYLKKISNYSKIIKDETLVAKYKKKMFTGKSKYECLMWLDKMLEKEL